MHRLSILQSLYNAAKINRQNGNEQADITPYYYSIYENDTVSGSPDNVVAISGNPKFIIGYTIHHYQYYGNRKDGLIFCYLNREGELLTGIPLSKWSISNIKTFQNSIIEGADFTLIGRPDSTFSFNIASSSPFDNMQMLWRLFVELNEHCNTVKEAELYYQYHLKKLELQQSNFTLEQYITQLEEQKNLVIQHSELLERIEKLASLTNR